MLVPFPRASSRPRISCVSESKQAWCQVTIQKDDLGPTHRAKQGRRSQHERVKSELLRSSPLPHHGDPEQGDCCCAARARARLLYLPYLDVFLSVLSVWIRHGWRAAPSPLEVLLLYLALENAAASVHRRRGMRRQQGSSRVAFLFPAVLKVEGTRPRKQETRPRCHTRTLALPAPALDRGCILLSVGGAVSGELKWPLEVHEHTASQPTLQRWAHAGDSDLLSLFVGSSRSSACRLTNGARATQDDSSGGP